MKVLWICGLPEAIEQKMLGQEKQIAQVVWSWIIAHLLAPGGVIEQGLVHRNDTRGSFMWRMLRRTKHFPRIVKEHIDGIRLFFLFGRTI